MLRWYLMYKQQEMSFETFYEISERLKKGKVIPSLETCIPWLEDNGLIRQGRDLKIRNGKELVDTREILVGLSVERSEKRIKHEIDIILEKYKNLSSNTKLSKEKMENIWGTLKYPKQFHLFNKDRLSPDALAFYRPFHFTPYADWGIYLLVDKLLTYYSTVKNYLGIDQYLFQSNILLGYIVFEVFHHEFFHHIVESTATTLEILSAAFGKIEPLYIKYFNKEYQKINELGPHPDDPLEEALANAYAYNSFSFSSRIIKGYKSMLVKAYQQSIVKGWEYEPDGYRSAGNYINSKYIFGATQLIGMILKSDSIDPSASAIVAKNVLLNGHSAFCSKPEIPTYLVGSPENLKKFYELIPAPNETYTNLFWHEEYHEIEKFIEEKRAQEKKNKENK
jgi:hypothetical protein